MRTIILALLACCVCTGSAHAWTTPAAFPGVGGQQHITYPSWTSTTHGAPWMTVGNVGDVNGDGREDVAAGFNGWGPDSGAVYVTFSTPLASVGDALGLGGFKIRTPSFWYGLGSAGDVNGDGLGDVAVVRSGEVTVLFGRIGGEVDADAPGEGGFRIVGAGGATGRGFNGIMLNSGLAPLGDVNGDGVPDLLVSAGGGASIVYPPRLAAGTTIDASAPGPHVSTIRVDDAHALDTAAVDVLGDVDRDGRTDVMVGGEERSGTDQVVYGAATPLPGAAIELPAAIDAGKAFAIRTHDGQEGWYGELEQIRSIGDQNGDGLRDVAMLCGGCGGGGRQMRAIYAPAFGTRVDAGSLFASDSRGWSLHLYSDIVDVGDQDGDGVGDIGDRSYVYFPDPPNEPGTHEPVHSGFYFDHGEIAASLADVNGDGRREIAIANVAIRDTDGDGPGTGESATYSVDIFDSAVAPQVELPDVPVVDTSGNLDVGVDIGSGAGTRADDVLVHPTVELATAAGAALHSATPGALPGSQRDLHVKVPATGLVDGQTYRVRATARNARGQEAEGPWRSFVFDRTAGGPGTGLPPRITPPVKPPGGRAARVAITPAKLRMRKRRVAVGLTCTGKRCRGRLKLRSGSLALGTAPFDIAAGKRVTVRLKVTRTALRRLRGKRSVRVLVIADAGRSTARVRLRLRLR